MIAPELLTLDSMWYLATVYSKHPDGLEAAFQMASRAAGRLLQRGVCVYSPIAHTHPIAIHGGLDPYDHGIWLPFDEKMMQRCDGILVLRTAGWETSKGINAELAYFGRQNKPIYYTDLSDI